MHQVLINSAFNSFFLIGWQYDGPHNIAKV